MPSSGCTLNTVHVQLSHVVCASQSFITRGWQRTIIGKQSALEPYPLLLERFDSVSKSMYTLFQVAQNYRVEAVRGIDNVLAGSYRRWLGRGHCKSHR